MISMHGTVKLLSTTQGGLRVCAAAARVATGAGTALQVYEKSLNAEKDLSLIKKVLASGHESILEHLYVNLAFTDVSVLVEQYMIEHRLASFMVKSRRYVDFGNTGFYEPEGADEKYLAPMRRRFSDYNALIGLGIPKEDARFVLPYCFHSNFYVSANARSLSYIVSDMLSGHGSPIPEIKALGRSIQEQFEQLFPGIFDFALAKPNPYKRPKYAPIKNSPEIKSTDVELISRPTGAKSLLDESIRIAARFGEGAYLELIRDVRPRELEQLNYTFRIKNASLACVTHFARHRMYSPIFPEVLSALQGGGFIVPDTVAANKEALLIYKGAFEDQSKAAHLYRKKLHSDEALSYFALSGNTVDFLMTINARELIVFSKLRACNRAQWEIREFASQMLRLLRDDYYELFSLYGPSCLMDGRCPEGKLSCGRPSQKYDNRI